MSARILLVEGDPNAQQSVRRMLDDEHIETVRAGDGTDAVFLLNETGPDLLIADIRLPDKSGYELCRYVREEPEFESLPVVLLDTKFDTFNQSAAYSIGADVYLSRPFEANDLKEVVRDLLERRKESNGEPSEPAHSERAIAPLSQPTARQVAMVGLPEAAAPQSRLRSRALFWAIVAAAALAVAWLALLDRKDVSNGSSAQRRSLAGQLAAGNAAVIGERRAGEAPATDSANGSNLEGASTPEGEGASQDGGESGDAGSPPGDPSGGLPFGGSTVVAAEPGAETRPESEPHAAPPAAASAASNAAPDVARANTAQPVTRPREIRSRRSTSVGGHFRRSGREMKQAAAHFGSGAKHFGKGSGKATLWTGKKAARGVKRVASSFKKLF